MMLHLDGSTLCRDAIHHDEADDDATLDVSSSCQSQC